MDKYRANELLHARWAMLAAAGIIIPEGLQVGLRITRSRAFGHICTAMLHAHWAGHSWFEIRPAE